ncbi:hypothetical protein QKW35_14030 [Pontibacterium granulatum]|nr:hypothetical protein [Pontibacterium granulatum]
MDVIFMDLEASGLSAESYPIEVAWRCPATGRSDNFFINPDSVSHWRYWDEFAEELHGLDRERLVAEGISAEEACDRLNDTLDGETLISDALEFDSFWIQRLFKAIGKQPSFRIAGLDELLTAEQLIQYRFIARGQFRRHRAMQDVEDLIIAVEAVTSEQAEND